MSKTIEEISKEDKWWNDVLTYAASLDYPVFEKGLWIETYYADGYSPEEAVREDWSYLQ